MSPGVTDSDDTKIYCKHMEEAVKRKSKTFKHPNRDFYCCKRPVGGQGKCDFFLWADEVPPKSSVADVSASGLSENSVVPYPLKGLGAGAGGLQQHEQGLGVEVPGLLKEPGPSTSLSGADAVGIPQPPSPVPTEVDGDSEAEVKPEKSFGSFLGLCPSPQPPVSTIQDEGQPSTPKKPRLSQAKANEMQPTTGGSGGSLPTPPHTRTKHSTEGQFDESKSAVSRTAPGSSRKKGKGRGSVSSPRAQDQNERVQDDQMARRSDQLEGDALPLFASPGDAASISSSASPTIAENVLDYTEGLRARVKVLSEYMDSFDISQATKSLQTVERQKMQYECRDQGQKTRIAELVAEVSRLRGALERSEANNRAKDAEIARLRGGGDD